SVRDALARLPFIIRCGRGMFGPARVLLDQKALRVKLSASYREKARLPRSELEPFYTALEEPAVETADGRPIEPIYLSEETSRLLQKAMIAAIRESLQQLSPFGGLVASINDEALLAKT